MCIVHQIRNSLRYVTHEDSKQVLDDLKAIYQATSLEAAESSLLEQEAKWKTKYPILAPAAAVRSWLNNWERLATTTLKKIKKTQFNVVLRLLLRGAAAIMQSRRLNSHGLMDY